MGHRIFVSYATGDETHAKELYDSLTKLGEFEVYIPELVQNEDLDFNLKVKNGMDSSKVVVVLMTFNSTNTVWLNQEIGYATAKNIPLVLIVEQGIELQGFLKGKDYFVFNRGDFNSNVQQIITKLRLISK